MIKIAFFQPDIPQNLGAAMRLCACLGVDMEVIEPCGFIWDRKKIDRSAMDYKEAVTLNRHSSWEAFLDAYPGRRIILMTTRAAVPYTDFAFSGDDILLAGRESSGAPDYVHEAAHGRIVIPMKNGLRSLNIVNATAMIAGEALRQTAGHGAL